LKKQVLSVKTDSKGIAEPKDPKNCLPFILLSFLISEAEQKELAGRLTEGGMGYAELKTKLFETLLEYFGEAREKRLELEKKWDFVEDALKEGAKKARALAIKTMEVVRRNTGLG
jgi:tryptophanyl-tRNA synthetase